MKESDEPPQSLSFFSQNHCELLQVEVENDTSLSMFDIHVAKEVEENEQMVFAALFARVNYPYGF